VRFSLRLKIVGGFGLLLLLIVILGWVTLSLFSSSRRVQDEVFDDAIPGLVTVDEIVRSYTAQSAAVRGALIGNMPVLLAQYQSEVQNSGFWEQRADDLFTSPEERELLSDLTDAGQGFHELVDKQVVPLAEDGQRSQAFRILGQDGTTLISDIERLGGLLRETQRGVVLQSEADVQSTADRTILILVVVLIAALLLAMFLTVVLPSRLVKNVHKLVEAARAIGRGDLDQRVDIRSNDEIGELAVRFREMQSGLKRLQQLALQDRELEIAASIQRNLLQRSIPHVRGVEVFPLQRQANLVGGDWYDVDATGRSLSVVVGDASGKGIGAALMATVALSALRSERARGADPKQILASANQALREATDAESFTTLIYAQVDGQTGEVRWMNMGHHPPFLIRPTGPAGARGFYLEGPRNRALGWFEDPGLAETVVSLQPGDRLVLFTDGFLEAKSADGEVFGEHRLAEAMTRLAEVPADALGALVVESVESFAAGKLDDDLTILVVEFQGAEAPGGATEQGSGDEAWHSRR
jgi:serine phosphatase RsbU (regulator of sigma subunit)/CHASE3 domain sensor protein